jgi:hypothetical protein
MTAPISDHEDDADQASTHDAPAERLSQRLQRRGKKFGSVPVPRPTNPVEASGKMEAHPLSLRNLLQGVERDTESQTSSAKSSPTPTDTPAPPITETTDPRWVLAVRTAEHLQGTVIPSARREMLIRAGQTLGLSAFDASLVIAVIIEQARRGIPPHACPSAGEADLRMVPLPKRHALPTRLRVVLATVLGVLVVEAVVIALLLF